MASHKFDVQSGFYRIQFRYGGRKFNRSQTIKITTHREAEAKVVEVEQTISLLNQGVIRIPDGIDVGESSSAGGN